MVFFQKHGMMGIHPRTGRRILTTKDSPFLASRIPDLCSPGIPRKYGRLSFGPSRRLKNSSASTGIPCCSVFPTLAPYTLFAQRVRSEQWITRRQRMYVRDNLICCFQARLLRLHPVQRHLDATDSTSLYVRVGKRLVEPLVVALAVVDHGGSQILLDACTLDLACKLVVQLVLLWRYTGPLLPTFSSFARILFGLSPVLSVVISRARRRGGLGVLFYPDI